MTIYVYLHETRRGGRVIIADSDVRIEVSPKEGYNLDKVTAFEHDLGDFVNERLHECLEKDDKQ